MGWIGVFRGVVAACALGVLLACGGGGGDDDELQLGDGVEITGEILGGSSDRADVQADTNNLVTISIAFKNTTDKEKTVVFPACFSFVDPSGNNQDGLSIWRREVVVPAKSTTTLKLGTYCMNSNRSVPRGGITYELGGKVDNDDLKELCELLGDSVVDRRSDIQSIVWKITNGGELEEEDIDLLRSIADGKSAKTVGDGAAVDKATLLQRTRRTPK